MWRTRLKLSILAVAWLLSWVVGHSVNVAAESVNVPSLTISQLKITSSNGQFITLYNATDSALDLSRYQLQYFNSYDLGKATSSRLIALSGTLPPHGYYLVNDSVLALCYQLTVNSVSLGLSSTAGLVQVLSFSQAGPGASALPVLQDYVGWSKTAAAGAQTLPANTSAFLQRLPLDSNNNPVLSLPGGGSWQTVQPNPTNACKLLTAAGEAIASPGDTGWLLPSAEPPATVIDLLDSVSATTELDGFIPPADIGLMAPQITELMPNPDGTGNDSTDEFIELYNPNSVSFDLSGFILQTGLTSSRTYKFLTGSLLPPKSFTAFYSEQTGLSLSNTGSVVRLLDPLGNSISASLEYSNAKDGVAWALANGKWYWTTSPTPKAENVIKQPVTSKKAKTTGSKAKTTKASSTKPKATKTATNKAGTAFLEEPTTTPIHTSILAAVGGGALIYGAYEYRTDLANRFHQLRSYLGARRANRQ